MNDLSVAGDNTVAARFRERSGVAVVQDTPAWSGLSAKMKKSEPEPIKPGPYTRLAAT
jgi:hypothetical protein